MTSPVPTSLDPVERTALLAAALRAAETAREDPLHKDPYAARLAGDDGPGLLAELLAVAVPSAPPGGARPRFSTPDYNAVRTRFFDGYLRDAVTGQGITQVVLAPAGMDSRAWRMRWPAQLRWFEIDRPSVLRYKADVLAGETPQADRRAVPTDLTADDWESRLLDSGYDPALPSAWLLEGLLFYLPGAEAHRLLERCAALMTPGSRIAADLVNAAGLTLAQARPVLDVFAGWGCPWLFGSDEPEEFFAGHGFDVAAVQPGEPGAAYGRWAHPAPARSVPEVRRVFMAHGTRR